MASVVIKTELEKGGERLYFVTDSQRELPKQQPVITESTVEIPDTFSYSLTEKNICVLDMASVSIDGETKVSRMEVLKADRSLRDLYGLAYRGGGMMQPWYQIKYKGGNTELVTTVDLHYTWNVQSVPGDVRLVVEELEHIKKIAVNGTEIALNSVGRWLDICFDELAIAGTAFKEGINEITVTLDYYKTSGIEAIYLLGDFGVKVDGEEVIMTVLPKKLTIGDITLQGLPFYTGSVIYEVEGLADKEVLVSVENFGGSLIKLLGENNKVIAFAPHQEKTRGLTGIEVVFNRRNTFGPLHEVFSKKSALEASFIKSMFDDVP